MPSSTSSSRPASRVPAAFLIALLAYAAADRLIWSYRPWLTFCARYGPIYRTLDYPMRTSVRVRLLPSGEDPPPILLLGSSQVYLGLDCAPFELRFPGRSCQNLGVAAGTPLDMLFLLDQADRSTRKRVTVIAFFPSSLHKGPKPAFTDVRTVRVLAKSGVLLHMRPREWVEVLGGLLQNSSETLRMNASLQAMWKTVGADLGAAIRGELPPPRMPKLRPFAVEDLEERMRKVRDREARPGRFTPANEWAIQEIISRETGRGNRVIVVDCPTRDGYEKVIPPAGTLHYQRLLADLARRSDVTVVKRTELPPVEDSDFRDFVHLLQPGRDKTSAALADILARLGV